MCGRYAVFGPVSVPQDALPILRKMDRHRRKNAPQKQTLAKAETGRRLPFAACRAFSETASASDRRLCAVKNWRRPDNVRCGEPASS